MQELDDHKYHGIQTLGLFLSHLTHHLAIHRYAVTFVWCLWHHKAQFSMEYVSLLFPFGPLLAA